MSSQKGNVQRSRPQKYQNSTKFSNTKYDSSEQNMKIISVTQDGLCMHCKQVIEWKVKYKKYKPLTQPSTCVCCHERTVKKAYYTVCQKCANRLHTCAKCARSVDNLTQFQTDTKVTAADQCQINTIRQLSERERRTLLRVKRNGKLIGDASKTTEEEIQQAAEGTVLSGRGRLQCDDSGDYNTSDELVEMDSILQDELGMDCVPVEKVDVDCTNKTNPSP